MKKFVAKEYDQDEERILMELVKKKSELFTEGVSLLPFEQIQTLMTYLARTPQKSVTVDILVGFNERVDRSPGAERTSLKSQQDLLKDSLSQDEWEKIFKEYRDTRLPWLKDYFFDVEASKSLRHDHVYRLRGNRYKIFETQDV